MDPSTDERWEQYRSSLLYVEVAAQSWVWLTGPDAVDASPFGETVYLITGHDPFGRSETDAVNAASNARLAARLVELGERITRAVGSDPVGPHSEPGYAVRGLDREAIRALGREFEQEAVFEIDAEGIRIVDCYAERVVEVRSFG